MESHIINVPSLFVFAKLKQVNLIIRLSLLNNNILRFKTMKKLLLISMALFVSMATFAQSAKISRGWNNFYAEYNYMGISWDYPVTFDSDDIHETNKWKNEFDIPEYFNGLSFGYSRTISLSPFIPLYLEVGGAMQLSLWSGSATDSEIFRYTKYEYEDKYDCSMLSMTFPVNVLYHFDIPHTPLSLEPFTGFFFRGNLWGNYTEQFKETEYTNEGDSSHPRWRYENEEEEEYSMSIFDKTKIAEEVEIFEQMKPVSRLQYGIQVGGNFVLFNRFFFGMSYAVDLNAFQENFNAKYNTFSLKTGVRF